MAVHPVCMAVSSARIREIRSFLNDAARDLEGSPEFAELAEIVGQAADAMDEMVDERGQMTEAPPMQVGSRVKREAEKDKEVGDVAGGDNADPDALPDPADPEPQAKKRKLPPQFRR